MSVRVMTLAALAATLIAAPVCYTLAQPAETPAPKPAPTDAPKPADAPARGQPGGPGPGGAGGPGGEGRRGPGGPDGGRGGGRGGDGASLPQSIKQAMMIMNRAMKTLNGQIGDAAKKDDNLKLVADMQRGCLAAKSIVPEKAVGREADAAKKTQMTTDYRKDMILMMEKMLKLETAIMEGKTADAQKLLAEIGDLRDQGHSEFNVRE